jgi:predicted nucleic acid-binding protein
VRSPRRTASDHGLSEHLGAGEAEVIALALEIDEAPLIVLDDGPGRRAARERGLDIVGTAGLLVLAKEAGLLPAVRPVLDELVAAGLFLGGPAYRDVLSAAGEV